MCVEKARRDAQQVAEWQRQEQIRYATIRDCSKALCVGCSFHDPFDAVRGVHYLKSDRNAVDQCAAILLRKSWPSAFREAE